MHDDSDVVGVPTSMFQCSTKGNSVGTTRFGNLDSDPPASESHLCVSVVCSLG